MQAAKEATVKAETAADKRFESVNEFRQTLSDQTNTFVPRPEYTAQHKALEDKVDAVTDRMNLLHGRSSGYSQSWAIFVALITIAILLATLIVKIK